MRVACIIGLSINEDLKLKKRKGRDRQQHEKLYTITRSREGHVNSAYTTITAVFCQCRNIYYPIIGAFTTSALEVFMGYLLILPLAIFIIYKTINVL